MPNNNRSSISAAMVLDIARARHPRFAVLVVPDGALLHTMNVRQRILILAHGGAIEGLISASVQLGTSIDGVLVGQDVGVPLVGVIDSPGWPEHVTEDDVPYVDFSEDPLGSLPPASGSTYADGWPVHMDDDGVPYVDFTEIQIAGDPFGKNGGVPGFPLPNDFVKIIAASCVYADATLHRITVIAEAERFAAPRSGLTAFVSGNRLVPLRPLSTGNTNDAWAGSIESVQLSYIALPVLTSLADTLVLPAPLHEALIAGVAEMLAFMAPNMPPNEKSMFSAAARRAEAEVDSFSVSMVDTAQVTSVQFRG